ncbi:hypothetical protein PF008_g28714 [Phytophthora fragariae]|uniref:Uncharacterized protein n=1 Tax=Phytophthora fragariae TaxID=53985 RepID=A0A6G0QAH1_9STRA|nr:hypothetical protein PF008_g28714 [Phytophthora fragariae]
MGSTFTAGGNVSSVSGADYDSRGNFRNVFVALLLSGNSCDGDGVRGDGNGVRGDGDGMECVVMIMMCTAIPLVMLSTDGESSVTMLGTSAMTNMKGLSAKVTASRVTTNTMKLSKMTKGTLMTPRQ